LAVERVAVAGLPRDRADTGRERDRHRVAVDDLVETRREEPADGSMRLVGIGPGHDDRELVATDAERPVAAPEGGRDRRPSRPDDAVAARVPARVVDLLEVVEVDDRQREWLVVAGRGRPRP